MPDAGHGVDGCRYRFEVGAAVNEGGPGGTGGQFHGRHRPVVGIVDALRGLPNSDDDGCARVEGHVRNSLHAAQDSRASAAVSDGVLPTLTPAASRASFLAAAVPDEPDTIAPA